MSLALFVANLFSMNLAPFATYLFTMMVSLTPMSQHAFYESEMVTAIRYSTIAETMARVIGGETISDGERLKVGAVMVSIGDAESHWRADVVHCKVGGDGGKAWGPWQTQLPKEKVCTSTEAALRLALGMVKTSFLACKDTPKGDRLSWYTDGGQWNTSPANRARAAKRSQWRMNRALFWVRSHPFSNNATSFNAAGEVP